MRENMFRAVALTAMLSVGMAAFAQDEPEVCEAEKKSEVIMHRVSYVANDGTDDRVDTMFQHGTNMCGLFYPNYRHTVGRYFVGWNTEPDGSGYWWGGCMCDEQEKTTYSCYGLRSDITVYAIWKYLPQPKAVDLGLPSGTLWADANLWADSPEDKGVAYKWADIYGVLQYKWADVYREYQLNESYSKRYERSSYYSPYLDLRRYELSNLITDPSDDAALVHLGQSWRTPTRAEFDELLNNCDWVWYTRNGVPGYVVSSKVNQNSIFFPVFSEYYPEESDETIPSDTYLSSELADYNVSRDKSKDRGCLTPWEDMSKWAELSYVLQLTPNFKSTDAECNERYSLLRPVCSKSERVESKSIEYPAFSIIRYDSVQSEDPILNRRIAQLNSGVDTLSYVMYELSDQDVNDVRLVQCVDHDGLPFPVFEPQSYFDWVNGDGSKVVKWSFFKSWNTKHDGTGTTLMPGDSISLDGNMTLYSQWEDFANVAAVDLGLPSGNLWLSQNVGAMKPEDIGYYFLYGQWEPITWFSYKRKHMESTFKGSYEAYWKEYYNTEKKQNEKIQRHLARRGVKENFDIQQLRRIVSDANENNLYRCPSKSDYEELMTYCDWKQVVQSGVVGYLVTSKVNSNSIFLPATGFLDSQGNVKESNRAHYWTDDLREIEDDECTAYHLKVRRGRPSVKPIELYKPMPIRLIKRRVDYYERMVFYNIYIPDKMPLPES